MRTIRPRSSRRAYSDLRASLPARLASAPQQVRIIGGQWRQTRIPVAAAAGLRPTPDRVRVRLFDWLAHLVPDLARTSALDLFAGTGALGIELASRGARRVVLVERQPALAARLQALVDRLQARTVEVVAGDALAYAARQAPASFDLVFLDPPYDAGLLPAALATAVRLLTASGMVYAESPEALSADRLAAADLQVLRQGRAGRVQYYLLRRIE